MHICIVFSTPIPPREGIGNYVYNMSKKFIGKGHEVTLVTRGGVRCKKEYFDNIEIFKPVFIPCYPLHVHFHGIFVNKLFKRLEAMCDVVHIHTPLAPVIATKLPIVSTVHTPMKTDIRNFESVGIFSYLSKVQCGVSCALEQKLLKRSNMVTAVSNTVAQELVEWYGLERRGIEVIYNGVDEKIFAPNYNKPEKKYILYVGSLAYRKGLFDLVECGKYICKEYPDVDFIIVGDGMLKDKLQKKVKKLELGNKIVFKGHVPKTELIRLYQNATIHILPSHYEGLPTVLLEAMSCGLPVVATAVSGNLDVISDGENGILIPPKSPKKMADAISMLLDDYETRRKLGKNARETIEKRFTWDLISDKVLGCYGSLMK
jgi:glycosyltransferase involved in cell wall biosynthesis